MGRPTRRRGPDSPFGWGSAYFSPWRGFRTAGNGPWLGHSVGRHTHAKCRHLVQTQHVSFFHLGTRAAQHAPSSSPVLMKAFHAPCCGVCSCRCTWLSTAPSFLSSLLTTGLAVESSSGGWVRVKWAANDHTNAYRYGAESAFDVELVVPDVRHPGHPHMLTWQTSASGWRCDVW